MTTEQLKQLVTEQNEAREREVVHEAKRIIEQIARAREQVVLIEGQIAQLQAELKALEIVKLDPVQILGNL